MPQIDKVFSTGFEGGFTVDWTGFTHAGLSQLSDETIYPHVHQWRPSGSTMALEVKIADTTNAYVEDTTTFDPTDYNDVYVRFAFYLDQDFSFNAQADVMTIFRYKNGAQLGQIRLGRASDDVIRIFQRYNPSDVAWQDVPAGGLDDGEPMPLNSWVQIESRYVGNTTGGMELWINERAITSVTNDADMRATGVNEIVVGARDIPSSASGFFWFDNLVVHASTVAFDGVRVHTRLPDTFMMARNPGNTSKYTVSI